MCACTLCADRFLRSVLRSESFREYCRSREIHLSQSASTRDWPAFLRSWTAAIAGLPEAQRSRIDRELAAVNELSSHEGVAHLLEAGPDPDLFGDGGSDRGSVALWFLLHRAELFWDVFFHHERREADVWHLARSMSGLCVSDLSHVASSLAEALERTFRGRDGTRHRCIVDGHRLPNSVGFSVRVEPRHGAVGVGPPTSALPSLPAPGAPALCFVYRPDDGTVLLQSPLRSVDRVRSLLDCFGQAVLGAPVRSSEAGFSLNLLKFPFHPQPDADDMEMVRLKALHLRYPERAGRPLIKLETPASRGPEAIEHLIRAHVSNDVLEHLQVTHAELQVRLRAGHRSKHYSIRLWPDRCDVGRGPVSDRFLTCLRTWGL